MSEEVHDCPFKDPEKVSPFAQPRMANESPREVGTRTLDPPLGSQSASLLEYAID